MPYLPEAPLFELRDDRPALRFITCDGFGRGRYHYISATMSKAMLPAPWPGAKKIQKEKSSRQRFNGPAQSSAHQACVAFDAADACIAAAARNYMRAASPTYRELFRSNA